MSDYSAFLASKEIRVAPQGIAVDEDEIHESLFPFQRALVAWAAMRGRAALFCGTGLGKTRMQIEWARPIWYGIKEADTLQVREAREDKDERHLCPLQLGTIERCIRLWSNRGEVVFTPFLGIGSEAYQAVRFGRKAVGVELKASYFRVAVQNVRRAEAKVNEAMLFPVAGASST